VGAVYTSLSARLGKRLLDDVIAARSLKPRLTLAKALAYVLATAVHALTLLTAAAGLFLLFTVGWNPIGIFPGILLLVMAFELRPRVPQLSGTAAAHDAVAATLQLTGAIARELNTANLDAIVITPEYNAAFGRVGWRRRRVLLLGLPLFLSLDAQERVALLGHELGHGVNGDSSRGLYIGTALYSLRTWHGFLSPSPTVRRQNLAELLANAIMGLVAYIPGGALRLLSHLNWRESQRAEYLADYLAAEVAGTDAVLAMLAKLHYRGRFANAVHQLALNDRMQDLMPELRRRLSQEDVAAALHDGAQTVEQYRLDATHPPTAYRMAFLKAHVVERPQVTLSPLEVERLDRELSRFTPQVQKRLADRYLRSLYR